MMNSTAMGITKPAGNLEGHQNRGTKGSASEQICILMHPVRRRSQEFDYLLVVKGDERGDGTNQDDHDIVP